MKKIAIVYYSRRGQNYVAGSIAELPVGNTERLARMIQNAVGGDLFEIDTASPYPVDYTETTEVAKREKRESARPALKSVPNLSAYDVVFLGYPIWWGGAAWPVDRFVTGNDFAGKTVYPFCTSGSSGIGSSATDLAELCGTGEWQEGRRFPSTASADEVKEWVDGLGIER